MRRDDAGSSEFLRVTRPLHGGTAGVGDSIALMDADIENFDRAEMTRPRRGSGQTTDSR